MRSRSKQLQLQHYGEFPDATTGRQPDSLLSRCALNSVMSAVSDSFAPSIASHETKWDEVFIVATRLNPLVAQPNWRPAVNAYRCSNQFVIFVDLAGVSPDSIEVLTEPGRVSIRGRRPAPEPASDLAQLLALEIDQGNFERVLDLPQEIDPRSVTTLHRDGLLEIRLTLAA
jgi:HSP20 family protein